MNRTTALLLLAGLLLLSGGCFNPDPPHYETPLPNGLNHYSNGGELGWIGTPFVNNSSTPVYPTGDDWYCNEFAIIGDNVIGVEIQYAERAFVDPPIATRWFYLDTKKQIAQTFDSAESLTKHCESIGHKTVPEFVTRTDDTTRM